MVLKGRFGLHKKEVVIVSCDGFLKLIICSLRKLVKLWQFQLCKAAEERRMGRNNAVLKNYQSALKKGKSNLHTLEEKYFKKINVLCGRGIGFILVHCGNCNFYECCRGRQTLSQGREKPDHKGELDLSAQNYYNLVLLNVLKIYPTS